MDINEQLQPIVAALLESLKTEIEENLQRQISQEVVQKIAAAELDSVVADQISAHINRRLDGFNFVDVSNQQLNKIVSRVTDTVTKTLNDNASHQIDSFVKQKLNEIELKPLIDKIVESKVSNLVQMQSFPERSILHSSINFSGLKLTGDQVSGGIIEKFGSTGIEDLATNVQMTVMDHATAFEGALWAPEATIKGKLVVDGDLIINGDIPTDCLAFKKLVAIAETNVRDNLSTEFFQGFNNSVFDRIQTEGLDLDKITQSGKEIVKGNQLGYHIVDTNIQRLGIVRDFQTSGENLLSDTLYVTNGRIGVNTRDPSAVLSVWDEEVEIVANKRGQDRGFIGLPRRQELVIGVNSKDNIVCDVNGGVTVDTIKIGNTSMGSVKKVPNSEGLRGQIVWNEFPDVGLPIGWVCLGGHRWAKFGTIE
jgi:hypothetical protein